MLPGRVGASDFRSFAEITPQLMAVVYLDDSSVLKENVLCFVVVCRVKSMAVVKSAGNGFSHKQLRADVYYQSYLFAWLSLSLSLFSSLCLICLSTYPYINSAIRLSTIYLFLSLPSIHQPHFKHSLSPCLWTTLLTFPFLASSPRLSLPLLASSPLLPLPAFLRLLLSMALVGGGQCQPECLAGPSLLLISSDSQL